MTVCKTRLLSIPKFSINESLVGEGEQHAKH
ncbi:Uncharacterised protein [Legionella taurinensis]|nr:Uncharacterised protein [Legionella taurinensis]